MNGKIKFSKSLSKRLEILNIDNTAMNQGLKIIKNKISSTFVDNINFIQNNSDNIYIISGGFIEFIEPVANILGIKSNHIFCNSFIKDGNNYILDEKNIMTKDLAKIEAIKTLDLNDIVIVIGDGYTDYELKKFGLANAFILFTENVHRKNLSEKADLIAQNFNEVFNYINNE